MCSSRVGGWATVLLLVFGASQCLAQDWPQWRGPMGTGVSPATDLPTEWSLEEDKNIVWRTELPSWSGGTPIIWGDRIFVTSASEAQEEDAEQEGAAADAARPGAQPPGRRGGRPGQGRRGGGRFGGYNTGINGPGGNELLLICLAKEDGSELWRRVLDDGNQFFRKQNSSSPSPVTDGKHVWVVTGTGQVSAFDFEGNPLWSLNLQEQYGSFGLMWGYASSPLLYDGKIIIEVLHGTRTDQPSYLIALDGISGEVVWRQERPTDAQRESPDAYTTPALLPHGDGHLIVVSGGDYVTAHDPGNGREVWRAAGLNPERNGNFRIITSPVVCDGMIYAGTRRRPMLALRAGGEGDITRSHLAFTYAGDAGPDVPTPACDGEYLYVVGDQGITECLDADTGEVVWGPKRTVGGTVSASPLLADGKLYITNEQGETQVLAAGPEFREIARNELDGKYTISSIAVSGNRLYIRTAEALYCIGE